jgi:Major Facilitator Superfamily
MAVMPAAEPAGMIRLEEARGRWVLAAAALGSGLAMLDATVVNVALPTLGERLAGLQWTVHAHAYARLAAVRARGRRRDARRCPRASRDWRRAAHARQLALMQASFVPQDRAKAIGAWSGLGGIAAAIGPFLGGWLVQAASWRYVFLVNVPVAALVIVVTLRHVPESRDPTASGRFDVPGAVLGAMGLVGTTFALIQGAEEGMSARVVASAAGGVAAFAAFVAVERRAPHPDAAVVHVRLPPFRPGRRCCR